MTCLDCFDFLEVSGFARSVDLWWTWEVALGGRQSNALKIMSGCGLKYDYIRRQYFLTRQNSQLCWGSAAENASDCEVTQQHSHLLGVTQQTNYLFG